LTISDNDSGSPTLTASPATIAAGGTVTASWSGISTPTPRDWIGLYAPGAAQTAFIDWMYVSCSKTPGSAAPSGSCPFVVPSTVPPGTYQLRIFTNNQFTPLATSNALSVTAPVVVALTVSPTTVVRGGQVTASWSGVPAPTPTDWIGLYTPGAGAASFIDWIYVSCTKTPGGTAASGSCPFVVPSTVAAGTYQLRILANNQFSVLATSNNFTVQ
jgi:hypothetical protein